MNLKKIKPKDKFPLILLGIFLLILIWSSINPHYRSVWFSEHIVTIVILGVLLLTYKKFKFSNSSYAFIFFFLVINTIGSHYSYSEVPLFNLIKETFELSRNHYDRVAHFLYGFLFFFPFQEFISRKLKVKVDWIYLLTLLVVVGTKGLYEILEFASVFLFSKSTSAGFLGMQGDMWDAQKDMFLGTVGAGLSWLILWFKEK